VSVAAVVLAAGASRRLGRPKQTVVIGGETLLRRAVRVAHEAALEPVIVVVADAALVAPLESAGATVVLNREASEGIASSIRAGISAARDDSGDRVVGAVLMTCDQVVVRADHLRSLCVHTESATGSAYAGGVGIPAYFPRSSFDDLLKLQGDQGARGLLRHARSVAAEGLDIDIDTEADLDRARELFEN
jgi:molybdenum cofactor cytidylyltransferase